MNSNFEKLKADLSFWECSEDNVLSVLEGKGYTVEKTSKTALTDFLITKGKQKYYVELKTRKCKLKDYPDTMIGANKLWEAWNIYYKEGVETLFFFKFEDGLYFYNPTSQYRKEFKAGRWDRWGIDSKKWWIYINNNVLKDGNEDDF